MSDAVVIALEGELSFNTVMKHQTKLVKMFNGNKNQVTKLNLAKVTHCDSAGLALMIEAKRLAHRNDCQLVIESQPSQLKALAKFCNVSSILSEM